jgi:DNA-binding SARP family transcriptional activator/ActR/RegA family two-component response regulator
MFLLVDEHDWLTPLLEREFNEESQVLQVAHGGRALELAEKGNINLVFVAQFLPDMDSYELLRAFRSNFPSISLIFVAEDPSKATVISAFRNGANDYIEKPVDKNSFPAILHRTIAFAPHQGKKELKGLARADGSRLKLIFSNFPNLKDLFKNFWSKSFCSIEEPMTRQPQEHHFEPNGLADRESSLKIDKASELPLEVYFLGKFRVVYNGRQIDRWPNRRGRAIFAYLAHNFKKRVYRDILMDTFWPKSMPDSARNSLNVAIHSIRHIFQSIDSKQEIIIYNDECYFLNPEISMKLDVEEFLNSWKRARHLVSRDGIEAAIGEFELAAAIYKGDFMEEDLYENWVILERENLREIYLEILDKLSRLYSLDGKPEIAIDLAELILEKDNCRENVHRRIMQCYYRLGKRDKALKQYQKCVKILKSELEVEPTNETRRLYEKLKKDSLA